MEGVAPDAAGWTYAAGDGIEVTVTFSETVKVEWRPSSAGIATTGSRSQRLRLARLMGEFSDGFLTVVAVTAMLYGLRSTGLQ